MFTKMILGAVAMAVVALPATAQNPDRGARPGTLVALVATMPDSASRIIVLRRAGGAGDVILLREADATAADLLTAIAALVRSRATDGGSLPNTLRLRIPASARVRNAPPGLVERMEQALQRIRRAAPADVPGVGRARSGTIPVAGFRHRRG